MPYLLSCADVADEGCDYQAWAETREELMELAAAHGKEVHGFDEVTPELREKIEGAIQEA